MMNSSLVRATGILFLFCNFFLWCQCKETAKRLAGPSPKSEFVARPSNITVLEGHPAVLRCKMKEIIHNCQWRYLEAGLDMFDPLSNPVLVTEFIPTNGTDCSIKFSYARLIQSGQWICVGLRITEMKYVVSNPAFLKVIKNEDKSQDEDRKESPNSGTKDEQDISADIEFHLTDEGYIINTKLGDTAVLGCVANKELKSCSWIRPDGTKLQFDDAKMKNYLHEGNYTEGNCSLRINEVATRDEGNWRCVVSTSEKGDKLGPLIHLHVLEFGAHPTGTQGLSGEKENDSSLIIILVTTSVVLLIIIISLVFYMYKRVWRRNTPPHKYLESRSANSDYSTYGSTWLPGIVSKDSKLIDEGNEMHLSEDQSPNQDQDTRYLNMSGNEKSAEGYVTFPAPSAPPSMSSGTTRSTMPMGHSIMSDNGNSMRKSASVSLHSNSTLGNGLSDKATFHSRELPQRSDSVYSSGHLYEEIDEAKRKNYANVDEDPEGYMIPKSCSLDNILSPKEEQPLEGPSAAPRSRSKSVDKIGKEQMRAPPYSKIGETGLVPDTDIVNAASNHTYGAEDEQESYDAPSGPPVPVRVDSIDNPLASYDVPKAASQDISTVFL